MIRNPDTAPASPVLFDNGLVLLTDEMPWLESVSLTFAVPCGTIDDPRDYPGLSGMTLETMVRGAGNYDNRGLVEAFENLGADWSSGVSQACSSLRVSAPADVLDEVLPLIADIIRRPQFPDAEFEPARETLLQEIASLEDDPSRKMLTELSRIYNPFPWGRPSYGTTEGLEKITGDDIRDHYAKRFTPNGAILSVAGKIDRNRLAEKVERLFGDWRGAARPDPEETDSGIRKTHLPFESAQTHIGLATSTVSMADPDYMALRSAFGVLSGGMSSRLFTEVREKRGLCYSVSASRYTRKGKGYVLCYCGSSTETAQAALDVILGQFDKLAASGVTVEELDRFKIRAKSGLVMEQESSVSRAGSMVLDWLCLGRFRPMEEILDATDRLTPDLVADAIGRHLPQPFRLATLGPTPLKIDEERLG